MKLKIQSFSALSSLLIVSLLWGVSSCSKDTEYIYVQPATTDYVRVLSSLDWGTDTVYTVGHKTPDVDATCSAIAYANLMKELGYKCAPRLAGNINKEMAYVSNYFDIPIPPVLEAVTPLQRMILTDHSEYVQAVDGMQSAQIIQVIDHHNLGDIKSNKPLFCKVMPLGSACTVVYTSYKDLKVSISDAMAKVILSGIISDTRNLKNNATAIDSVALNELAAQLNLDKTAISELNRKMNEVQHNYTGMTYKEIFLSDYKDYNIEGEKLGIACVEWYDVENTTSLLENLRIVATSMLQEKSASMMFAMVNTYLPNPDKNSDLDYLDAGMYLVYAGDGAKEIAESAFGPSVGEGWVYTQANQARKSGVVPAITEQLKARK